MEASLVPRRGAVGAAIAVLLLVPAMAPAAGQVMFPAPNECTAEKPQSKLFYHAGAWWCVLQGGSGVAFYRLTAGTWQIGTFPGAVLQSSGHADVKWNGTHLFALVHDATPRLYKYTYNSKAGSWVLLAGFPVDMPGPSSSETMVLEQDSSGRLWITVEGGGSILVHYSTSPDHLTWSSLPTILASGVDTDDISSVIAFHGDRIGVFWSDQNREEYGFRVHLDADPPDTWAAKEIVYSSGSETAEDHVHLAADATGRVFAATKSGDDNVQVHRRNTAGVWATTLDVAQGRATRPIVMVSDADHRAYVLYTRWDVAPERIEYRYADLDLLQFSSETVFIESATNMNNVTGTKQPLPAGTLIAVAEDGSHALWNGFGQLGGGQLSVEQPPGVAAEPSVRIHPNPLRGEGVLEYSLSQDSTVRVDVFDVVGRRVRTLEDSPAVPPGLHVLPLDLRSDRGASLPAGVYLYRVQSTEGVRMGRFVVLD
jgi:hypothetical protein